MSFKPISLTPYQLRLLAVLALINFVNFADRQAIPPLVPLIRDEFALTSTQISYLQVALQGVLALASIPFGFFADRLNRSRIIAGGVIFWSFATIFTSHVHTFTMLLLARAFVGIGEAAYAPAAQSMISGGYPAADRARAQSVFAAGMLVGGTAGQAIGARSSTPSAFPVCFFPSPLSASPSRRAARAAKSCRLRVCCACRRFSRSSSAA